MSPAMQGFRDTAVRSLDRKDLATTWAFEYTPANSSPIDTSYLESVRITDIFVWLASPGTTAPVLAEVEEAIASSRRIWVVQIGDLTDDATVTLIERVKPLCKMASAANADELADVLALTFADEVARAIRNVPAAGRQSRLDALMVESRARCIVRWQAAGIDPVMAASLADDPTVLAPSLAPSPVGGRVRVLTGDFGSGKSLLIERIHQAHIVDARTASNPIPVYLDGAAVSDLRGAVEEAAIGIGQPNASGANILVDGIDQLPSETASRLLDQARLLTNVWPSTSVILTSRPSVGFAPPETVPMNLLSREEIDGLVSRVYGAPFYSRTAGLPAAVDEAIQRPLFAILLAKQMARSSRIGQTTAEMVADMIRAAVVPPVPEAQVLLRRLAVLITDRGGQPIPTPELTSSDSDLELLRRTRLVVEHRGRLNFALPLIAEWFAARSLIEGEVDVDELTGSANRVDMWRQPLITATGTAGHQGATRILVPLSRKHPGAAAAVVKAAIAAWGMHGESTCPPAEECGRRLRETMAAWCEGLGALAHAIAPLRSDGTVLPIGVRVANDTLIAGWYGGPEPKADIAEAPWVDAGGHLPPGWLGIRSATPSGQSAWAWRWTLDELVDNLTDLLDPRRRSLLTPALRPELIRKVAVSITGRGSLDHGPIPLRQINEALDSLVAAGAARERESLPGELGLLAVAISPKLAAGEVILPPVYPAPDGDYSDGWVWSPYSPQQLLALTTQVFQAALAAYEEVTTSSLAPLRSRMEMAVILPARLTGQLTYRRGPMGPGLQWFLDALPPGSESTVDIVLSDESSAIDNLGRLNEIGARLRAARPEAASWIRAVLHNEALGIFDQAPAGHIALKWINDDLARIGWHK